MERLVLGIGPVLDEVGAQTNLFHFELQLGQDSHLAFLVVQPLLDYLLLLHAQHVFTNQPHFVADALETPTPEHSRQLPKWKTYYLLF